MNKLLILLLSVPVLASAQVTQGTITYEETRQLNIDVQGEAAQFAALMPKEQVATKILYFQDGEALFKDITEDETHNFSSTSEEGEMELEFKVATPDDATYTNLEKGQIIEQRDFMGKLFLIEDAIPERNWKMTSESREILGYTCMKAVYEKDTVQIEAWFAPELPISLGPGTFSGLPGLVLTVNIDEGNHVILAKEISTEAPEKGMIEKPKKGKKVTEAEYEEIVVAKRKEMEEQYGGKGGVFITIDRDER